MTLRVSCAARGAYVGHSITMLRSIVAHRGDLAVGIHYLHGGALTRRAVRRLQRAVGAPVHLHRVAQSEVADLPVRGYFTSAMWYRILLPELMPNADRVLYLDVDTLAMDDLAPLWATSLDDEYLAAVTNVFQPDHLFHLDELGLAAERYFNSGVLLLNLEALRRDGCVEAIREVARARAGLRGWPDQDALNLVLGERRVALHPRWNCMNAVLEFPEASDVFGEDELAEARARPGIRHFEGPEENKPWVRGAQVRHADAWRAVRS